MKNDVNDAGSKAKAVSVWIFVGVGMLLIQVLLGGITRLTGSGLSITEWKPIMGAFPPSTNLQWQEAFTQYQQIAQFKYINQHISLADFKFLFFWEWFHRLWARLIGLVFIIPFVFFLVKNYFRKPMIVPLVALFLLGALQGAIGWIMVQSGLNDNDVYVSHIRLAVHFMAAMGLISYALIFGIQLTTSPIQLSNKSALLRGATILLVLISVQLVFGAFMAGLKAAATAPTWPLINGELVPAGITKPSFWHNLVYDKITIHFVHRSLAYIIAVYVLLWWFASRNSGTGTLFATTRNAALLLVLSQVCLGVLTVLNSPDMVVGKFGLFETLALLHQLTGMLLLLTFVTATYLLWRSKQVAL